MIKSADAFEFQRGSLPPCADTPRQPFREVLIIAGRALEHRSFLVRHTLTEVCAVIKTLSLATIDEVLKRGRGTIE
jgi:hypothetical protein